MTPTQVVQAQLDAYNKCDIEAFVATYSADVFIQDDTGKELCKGHKKLREIYGPMFRDNPNQFAIITNRIAAGSHVIDQEEVVGRADNVRRRAVAIYKVQGDVITHVTLIRG